MVFEIAGVPVVYLGWGQRSHVDVVVGGAFVAVAHHRDAWVGVAADRVAC